MNKRNLLRWTFGVLGALLLLSAILVLIFQTPDIPVAELKKNYADKKSRYLPVMGMSMHFRDEGPAIDSLPLVLLHGSGSSLHTWDSLVALMPGKRIIRMDLPGFGLTGPRPDGNYAVASYAPVLDSLFSHLKVDSCIMVGNSLGGLIAWTYAASHPEVRGLVLIDPAGFRPEGKKGGNLGFRLAQMPVVNQLIKYITPKSIVEKSLKESYGNPAKVSDALINRYYQLNLREGNRQAMIDRFRHMDYSDSLLLKQLHMPVLLLWGAQDQVIPPDMADHFMRNIPHAQKQVYPGIGHVPMEESPQLVNRSIADFMLLVAGK